MLRWLCKFLLFRVLLISSTASSTKIIERDFGIEIPQLPHGHLQYTFYLRDSQGALKPRLLTLQQVQDLLLRKDGDENQESILSSSSANNVEREAAAPFSLLWKEGGQRADQNSIEAVLTSVQKVMSSEMSHNSPKKQMTDYYEKVMEEGTSNQEEEEEPVTEDPYQGITIPATLLANLLHDKVSSLETHAPWATTPAIPITFEYDSTQSEEPTTDDSSDLEILASEHSMTEASPPEITKTQNDEENSEEKGSPLHSQNENSVKYETPQNSAPSIEDDLKINDMEFSSMILTDQATENEQLDSGEEPSIDSTTKPSEDTISTATIYEQPLETTERWELLKTKGVRPPSYALVPIEQLGQDNSDNLIAQDKQSENDLDSLHKTEIGQEISLDSEVPSNAVSHTNNLDKGTENEIDSQDFTTFDEPVAQPELIDDATIPSGSTNNIPLPEELSVNNTEKILNDLPKEDISLYQLEYEPEPESEPSDPENNLSDPNFDSVATNPETNDNYNIAYEDYYEPDQSNQQFDKGQLLSGKQGISNVLLPEEIASPSVESLGSLGGLYGKNGQQNIYDFEEPQFLEDLPPVDYDLETTNNGPQTYSKPLPNYEDLDFPSPDVASSYHQPDHVIEQQAASEQSQHGGSLNDPTQFLPAYNPEISKGENPLNPTPEGNLGLESSLENLNPVIKEFIDDTNELAFKNYKDLAKIHRRQNMVFSPLNLVSALSMLRIGARASTADALAKVLMTNDMYTFNPHLEIKKITDQVLGLNGEFCTAGIMNSLFIDKPGTSYNMEFFSRTIEYFYDAIVKETLPGQMGGHARDHANAKMRSQTHGAVDNFLKPSADLKVLGPLSIVSSAYFQARYSVPISMEDLFDMNFIRFPSAERRLIRTVGIQKEVNIMAGYNPKLDATIAEVPLPTQVLSLILVMPGRQKSFVANGLSQLEQSLTRDGWSELLRTPIPHQLFFKMPVFSHRNYLNLSSTLASNGLEELFSQSADLSGINGGKDLRVGDVIQLTEFHSIKLDLKNITTREGREFGLNQKAIHKELLRRREGREKSHRMAGFRAVQDDPGNENTPRDSRSDRTLAFDRAFFYVVRHNPTGLILFIGRYLDPETF